MGPLQVRMGLFVIRVGSGHSGGRRGPTETRVGSLKSRMGPQEQGRRIRGFGGAQAPPELRSAPPHCQKHPLR